MPYERVGTFKVEEVLHFITRLTGKSTRDYLEHTVKMDSQRYVLFHEKGTRCKGCGLEGTFFALERHLNGNTSKCHFNLYGLKEGKEVMLTKDHIIPKSRGGKNTQDNYQVLCSKCNRKKDNKIP